MERAGNFLWKTTLVNAGHHCLSEHILTTASPLIDTLHLFGIGPDTTLLDLKPCRYYLRQGFSNCGTRIISGTPATVQWYTGIVSKIKA
jgi:hypothetical protein